LEVKAMTERNEITEQASKAVSVKQPSERPVQPAVDIFEDDAGVTLHADVPGVSSEHLDIQVDSDSLTIDGKVVIPMPEGMKEEFADVRATRYQRSFSLSNELDGEKAQASLKDGVLELRIPKREQYLPRKIEVRVC
jgi:HSP20 family molecular chaperone IbpA